MNRTHLAVGLGLAGVLIFGATLPMTKLAVAELDPYAVSAGRAVGAGVLAALVLGLKRRPFPKSDARVFGIVGLCLVVGFPVLTALAMTRVPAAHGGVVTGLLPLATAVAAAWVNRERPSLLFWACGVAGSALVVAFALRDGGGRFDWGDLLLLAGVAVAALGYALSGRLSARYSGWEVISWALVVTLPLALVALAITWPRIDWSASPAAWIGFVYVAVFSQFIGFFFWNAALALGGVAKIGQLMLVLTFVTLALSAMILGEDVDAETWLAGAAIIVIVAVGQRARVGFAPASEKPEMRS